MSRTGPGPRYGLPSLTGYDGHDPTRFRYPANSLSPYYPAERITTDAPAPKYDIGNYTRKGLYSPRAAGLGGKPKFTYTITPGPGRYAPELYPDPRYRSPPSCTLGSRRDYTSGQSRTPGASKYTRPTTIGPEVIDMKAAPAYTMSGRPKSLLFSMGGSPGPGRYGVSEISAYKKRTTSALILGPYKFIDNKKGIPAPKYAYTYNTKMDPPSFSFGDRHSELEFNVVLPEDKGAML